MNILKEDTRKKVDFNNEIIQEGLVGIKKGDISPSQTSTAGLAFLGDAVYSLLVRQWLTSKYGRAEDLHKSALKYVSAVAQAKAAQKILGDLSPRELSVYKRGRNMHTANKPKGATEAEYHNATALEVLFGYLYLANDFERIRYLFSLAVS